MDQDKAVIETTLIVNLEKCIKLFVLNARKNVKCHSNQAKTQKENQDLFFAENALLNNQKNQEDINLISF